MKTINRKFKNTFVILMISIFSFGISFATNNIVVPDTNSVLTQNEINGLIKMREEEKLAHDVYTKLYEKWDYFVFKNISESELRHSNAIKYLLAFYEIDDPYKEGIGNYSNPEIEKLYEDLVDKGSKSLEEALKVGATIEDLDIADLTGLVKDTKDVRIKQTYDNLLRGSRNHLRSFITQLDAKNIVYTPKFITQEKFNSIVSSDMERGGFGNRIGNGMQNQSMAKGNKQGKMKGKGRGNGNGSGNMRGRRSGGCNGSGMGRRSGMGR